jgi:hypothetical protein
LAGEESDELEDDEVDDEDEAEDDVAPRAPWRIGRFLQASGSVFVSLIVHLVLFVALGVWMLPEVVVQPIQEIVTTFVERREDEELLKVELDNELNPQTEINKSTLPFTPQVGVASSSDAAGGAAGSGSTTVSAPQLDTSVAEQVEGINVSIEGPLADAPPANKLVAATPDGALGDPRAIVDDYDQAMDQITQEILWFMEKSPVLVVWCFDQSESMKDDQKLIRDRIERVYAELGLTSHLKNRLTTGVCSFGEGFMLHTPEPTSSLEQIRAAIDAVPSDPSGKEIMCEAVGRAIALHREYAEKSYRKMLLILVTDESGEVENNNAFLERAIAEAKAAKCRVYAMGREAVFGYPYAHIRWVHPQTKHTHWLRIDRGPETAFVEQLQTDGFRRRYDAHPSGFGPYEQTRLARETGGVFFMLPGLESNLVRGENRRYELEAMRAYRPDLRARIEIITDRDTSILRRTVWQVIYDLNPYNPEVAKIIEMRVEFSPQLPQTIQQARIEQAKAIIYLQYLARVQQVLEGLAEHRAQEASPRWQANYDLIYAQTIAYQARMYEYGAYLEQYIQNPKVWPPTKAPNNILHDLHITTRKETLTTESLPYIEKATELYKQVVIDHPGTPWSARAELELKRGFGVEFRPDYHPPYPTIPPGTKLLPIPKL